MKAPFFSIITVSLNAGIELRQTVSSVLMQKFDDFELIVKDGGSSDSSLDSLPKDSKISIFNTKDRGIYDAMNQALSNAIGKYILFLNAGDCFYDDEVLSSFYQTITKYNYPSLVYCDYTATRLGVRINSPEKLSKYFLFRTMLCHQVCMINSGAFKADGKFNTDLKVVADFDFLLRLILIENASYFHLDKLGIISSSGGFSFHNRSLALKEVQLLRKKYFPDKYFLYYFYYLMTLPALRRRVARGSGLLAHFYQKIVNFSTKL